MDTLDSIRDALPEVASDTRLNLQSVLENSSLDETQRWGVAVACGYASRNKELAAALVKIASTKVDAGVIDDAKMATSLMSMNNVYYRFRHIIEKPTYGTMPARLRMNKLRQPKGSGANLELYCLAVSAINNCQACVQSHEKVVLEKGLTEENVNDAVRIAAVIQATAVSLELA
ncbi:MAG: carboxymuconolactone decarboxylase family protein [Polyangiaceae bacterium]